MCSPLLNNFQKWAWAILQNNFLVKKTTQRKILDKETQTHENYGLIMRQEHIQYINCDSFKPYETILIHLSMGIAQYLEYCIVFVNYHQKYLHMNNTLRHNTKNGD